MCMAGTAATHMARSVGTTTRVPAAAITVSHIMAATTLLSDPVITAVAAGNCTAIASVAGGIAASAERGVSGNMAADRRGNIT